jgi:hypothetical protein
MLEGESSKLLVTRSVASLPREISLIQDYEIDRDVNGKFVGGLVIQLLVKAKGPSANLSSRSRHVFMVVKSMWCDKSSHLCIEKIILFLCLIEITQRVSKSNTNHSFLHVSKSSVKGARRRVNYM